MDWGTLVTALLAASVISYVVSSDIKASRGDIMGKLDDINGRLEQIEKQLERIKA
jgi:hypothetical protein